MKRVYTVKTCILKHLAVNMVWVSPFVIGLGIADVYLTYVLNCTSGCTLSTALALTWVSVGIWAPIPVFIDGLAAFVIARKKLSDPGWLCLLSFMAAFIFTPALVVVTALELAYKNPSGPPQPSDPNYMQTRALFAIEITIAVVGFVLHLHAVGVLYIVCCCKSCLGKHMKAKPPKPQQQQPQQQQKPAEHHDDAIDRMNIWSAYRLMENSGQAPCQQFPQGGMLRSTYYASGIPPTRCTTAPMTSTTSPCQACNQRAPTPVLSSGAIYSSGLPAPASGHCQACNRQAPRQVLAGGAIYSPRW